VDLKIIPWGIMLLILLRPPMPPQITKLNTVCGKHHWVWWVFHRLVMIPWNNGRMLCFVIGYLWITNSWSGDFYSYYRYVKSVFV
jgi:hypothetical protein